MKLSPEEKKEKARWSRVKRVYGLTKEDYEKLDTGVCPICLRGWSKTVHPCIDHDHSDGTVRGVVCRYCNHRLIGRHRDSSVLRRIADYLDNPRLFVVPPKKKKRKKRPMKAKT